ncbi:hypothetical protein DPMN_067565 [Dreissena polymorpha]|uniref:Uncharacterized protein n=1 Tax=Dreissena polymorpha TaxID=45954 RepID=A0A9D3YZV4_DREPO|nr:hypothetical protein DPMN_067565 [Dreissena polymorpha]
MHTIDYCHVRGTHTEDDRYVHLCSICAATTRLADDFFPRYINEAICKTGDTDCFSIAGTHGKNASTARIETMTSGPNATFLSACNLACPKFHDDAHKLLTRNHLIDATIPPQTRFSLHMMRRKPETCRMLLHDGEALVFDDWELVPTWIRVACECTINKLSTFSRFAGNENLVQLSDLHDPYSNIQLLTKFGEDRMKFWDRPTK